MACLKYKAMGVEGRKAIAVKAGYVLVTRVQNDLLEEVGSIPGAYL